MEKGVGELTAPNFKTYCKVSLSRVWYWHEDRHIDQWNRIESPEINPHIHGQPIFESGRKSGKAQSLTNGARIAGQPHANK